MLAIVPISGTLLANGSGDPDDPVRVDLGDAEIGASYGYKVLAYNYDDGTAVIQLRADGGKLHPEGQPEETDQELADRRTRDLALARTTLEGKDPESLRRDLGVTRFRDQRGLR